MATALTITVNTPIRSGPGAALAASSTEHARRVLAPTTFPTAEHRCYSSKTVPHGSILSEAPRKLRCAAGLRVHCPRAGQEDPGLLAILGVHPDDRHSRDRLAGVIWSGVAEEHARHSLRQAIFAIRRLLSDDALSTVGDTIGLNSTVVAVDVAEFERASSESTPEAFQRAASLYRGDLLDGFRLREPRFEEWLVGERDRLRRQGVLALERLTQARIDSANREGAIESVNRLVTIDPTRERAHRTLMHLYTEAGRRAAAIRQYQICESVLGREFGVKPDAETRALYDRIVAPDVTRVTSNGPPKPSAVLIVEDEPVTRAVLEGFLGTAGYNITAVSDGAEALFQLSGRPFDLILSDIAMPMLDGLALAEVVARKGLRTPIIFITGQPGDELEIKGLESGAVDFIRKPIQKDVLLLRVRKALRAG